MVSKLRITRQISVNLGLPLERFLLDPSPPLPLQFRTRVFLARKDVWVEGTTESERTP